MTISINDAVLAEIDDLVSRAAKLSREASQAGSELGFDRIEELSAIASLGGQLIRRLYEENSQFLENWRKVLSNKSFTNMHSNHYEHVSELAGILRAVQHDIKSGLLRNLRGLLQAEIFADFLEMAEHLLREGYKDPAAVLLGAVLEDSLRKLAAMHKVATISSGGKPLTIDPLNASLAKAGAYGSLVQKQITTWANLRNDAAHGRFSAYDQDQVKQMLLFVQKFCGDYLQ